MTHFFITNILVSPISFNISPFYEKTLDSDDIIQRLCVIYVTLCVRTIRSIAGIRVAVY